MGDNDIKGNIKGSKLSGSKKDEKKVEEKREEIADVEKLKKLLKKAHRSVFMIIKNQTKETLLKKTENVNGKFLSFPPESIAAGKQVHFGAVGKGILAGTEGSVSYAIPGMEGELVFTWNNGKEKSKRGYNATLTDELKDTSMEVIQDGTGDANLEVIFTLQSSVPATEDISFEIPATAKTSTNSTIQTTETQKSSELDTSVDSIEAKQLGDEEEQSEPAQKKIQLEFLDKPIQATDEELKAATSLFKAKSKPAMNTRRKGKSLPGGEDTFDVREALKNTPRSGSISVSSKRITPQERDEDLNREGIRKLKTCLTQLETGYFEAALQSVEGSINDYTSLSDVVSKRKEIKICVSYKIALILLQEFKKQEDLNLLVFLLHFH